MPDLAAKTSLQGNIRIATEEELKLSSVLCAQSVMTLRQALKEPQTEIPSCLHFLELLLNGLHPELVRQEAACQCHAHLSHSVETKVCYTA